MKLAPPVLGVALCWLAMPAGAMPFNFEMRKLIPELGLIPRDVYVCDSCTLEQFEAIVPPVGWQKADARIGLWDSGSFELPTPPPGVAASVDFVPELPGEEFFYVARVLDGAVIGNDPDLGILAIAHVARSTIQFFDAGRVVHEVTDDEENLYLLFTFDYALSESTYDLDSLGSLTGLGLPAGWSYSSRVLDTELALDSDGLATVFAQGNVATYQLVPEPSGPLLVATGILAAVAGRRLFPSRVLKNPLPSSGVLQQPASRRATASRD